MVESNVESSVNENAEIVDKIPSREEKVAKFESLMNDGRKSYLVKDWCLASERLSEAAELSVKLYGEFAAETYSPHYYYGATLLELTSIEREIMDVKEKEAEEGNEDHLKEIKEELKKVVTKILEQSTSAESAEEEATSVKETNEKPTEDEQVAQENANAEEQSETIEVEDEEEEEEQEVEKSQLAFEALDYARVVCEKKKEKTSEWWKRESEVRILLAQCALNDGNTELGIEEYTKALAIVQNHFADELREIAFICMELNRANRQTKHFDRASENLENALVALEEFKKIKEKEVESVAEEEKSKLTQLVAEMDQMIADIRDEKRMNETVKSDCENKENANTETTTATSKMDETPIEIVSYKRKAKTDDAENKTEEVEEQKKQKLEVEEQQAIA